MQSGNGRALVEWVSGTGAYTLIDFAKCRMLCPVLQGYRCDVGLCAVAMRLGFDQQLPKQFGVVEIVSRC